MATAVEDVTIRDATMVAVIDNLKFKVEGKKAIQYRIIIKLSSIL